MTDTPWPPSVPPSAQAPPGDPPEAQPRVSHLFTEEDTPLSRARPRPVPMPPHCEVVCERDALPRPRYPRDEPVEDAIARLRATWAQGMMTTRAPRPSDAQPVAVERRPAPPGAWIAEVERRGR